MNRWCVATSSTWKLPFWMQENAEETQEVNTMSKFSSVACLFYSLLIWLFVGATTQLPNKTHGWQSYSYKCMPCLSLSCF